MLMHRPFGVTCGTGGSFTLKMDKQMINLSTKTSQMYHRNTRIAPPKNQRLTLRYKQRVITRTNESRRASFTMSSKDQDMYNSILRSSKKSKPLKEDFSQKLDFSVSRVALKSKRQHSRPISSTASREVDTRIEESLRGLKFLFVHRRPEHRRCYTVTQSDRDNSLDTVKTTPHVPRRAVKLKQERQCQSLNKKSRRWGEEDPWATSERDEDTSRGYMASRMGCF